MPLALPESSAPGAGFARIRRIDVDDVYTDRTGLVLDEALQLTEGPAVQSPTQPPAGVDARADVGEIFQHNLGDTVLSGFTDDGFAGFVIDLSRASFLPAGDLPEFLLGTLAAVGLEASTLGKVSIASIPQSFAAKDLARACGGQRILSDINSHYRSRNDQFRVLRFDGYIKEPSASPQDQIGLSYPTGLQDSTLMITKTHAYDGSSAKSVKRERLADEAIGTLIVVDAGLLEMDARQRLACTYAAKRCLCPIRFAYRKNSVARHLTSEGELGSQPGVGMPVQGDTVPAAVFQHKGYQSVAHVRVGGTQGEKSRKLFRTRAQFDTCGAQHGWNLDRRLRAVPRDSSSSDEFPGEDLHMLYCISVQFKGCIAKLLGRGGKSRGVSTEAS